MEFFSYFRPRNLVLSLNEAFDEGINYPDYARKLYLIENCIYGVDIQPIAIQISKLRFFISLVLDQKVDRSKENLGIRALPNLETKFVSANTLLGLDRPEQMTFKNPDIEKKEEELKQIRHKYFDAKTRKEKLDYQKKDQQTRKEIAELLKVCGWNTSTAEKIATFDLYDQNASAGWFDPEWMFGITSNSPLEKGDTGGCGCFDIVIANPPYVRHESIKSFKPQLAEEFGDFYSGTADIYTYFYKKGIDLLKSCGHLCFIAPNKFMRAGYGKNTRRLLATEVTPKVVIDFCDLPIFDATTYPSIILVEKTPFVGAALCGRPDLMNGQPTKKGQPQGQNQGNHAGLPLQTEFLAATFTSANQLERLQETLSNIGFPMPISSLREEGWNLERPAVLALMEKLRKTRKPLVEYVQGKFYYGIKTGLNEAFVIDAPTRAKLIAEDPESEELIKPWLRGRDIKKWKAEWDRLYLISIPSSANRHWPWSDEKTEAKAKKIFAQTYPAIYKYLSQWEDNLIKRDDQGKFWWELRSCAYNSDFERPKIIYPDIAKAPEFTWDESKAFLGNTAYIIPTDEIWLLGLLNSQLIWWLYLHISSTIQGGFVRFIAQYMEQLPIPAVSGASKDYIIERVNKILANPDSPNVPLLEAEIDNLTYDLYGLTSEEIEIVKGFDKVRSI